MKIFEEPTLKVLVYAPKDILTASSEETIQKPIIPTTPPDEFE